MCGTLCGGNIVFEIMIVSEAEAEADGLVRGMTSIYKLLAIVFEPKKGI